MAMRRNEVVEKEEQENKGNPVFGKNDNLALFLKQRISD